MARRARRPNRSIVLVGLMGAGKTTVGRRLARRLDLPFVDADAEIERAAGIGIAEIFERFGEARFREGERRMLARLVEQPPCVIAAGGGAFIDTHTRALILERCIAVWLDVDLDTLTERVSRRDHRPLLNGRDPRAVLVGLAAARNPIYAQAHIAVRPGDMSHDAVADRIVLALAGRAH